MGFVTTSSQKEQNKDKTEITNVSSRIEERNTAGLYILFNSAPEILCDYQGKLYSPIVVLHCRFCICVCLQFDVVMILVMTAEEPRRLGYILGGFP